MSRVEVEVFGDDELTGEVWRFYVHSETEMHVDAYERVTRKTKRHKWVVQEHWNRRSDRTAKIKKSELVLTPDLMAKAKRTYIERLEKSLVVLLRD